MNNKILAITITYNRLDMTKKYLGELKSKAGVEFKHIVVDNGSDDGTVEWLKENGYEVYVNEVNEGIVRAWIKGVRMARLQGFEPDYVVKFDNDCEIVSEAVLRHILGFYEEVGDRVVVSPIDLNIEPGYEPEILEDIDHIGAYNVKVVSHIGGMFAFMPIEAFDDMAKENNHQGVEKDHARGWFWRSNGYKCIYLKDLKVKHQGVSTANREYKF